ncbi:MAG: type III restriction-modification system subunit M [Candidatus Desulfovibrio kirbyi]|uniref:site-specific DNA-methyltransferase (adenine-specific) n=1 Tax=Candidatus Desulfovibrio kirbyi TaxID=2696086 RepID=A0A6L2R4Z9_9BACT|nr:MAG: type III restriction-modification system subunit M [Candidatus Desulfovibrio kirbyi]
MPTQQKLPIVTPNEKVEDMVFELPSPSPIKGFPELRWAGKRPFASTHYYPAQLKERYGDPVDGWMNRIYWGDNLQVMSHLLQEFRGKVDMVYIDPPFDSKAEYKKTISLKGKSIDNDLSSFEEKQYTDLWSNDEYLQFIYERLILLKELLSNAGCIYLHCDYRKSHELRCLLDEIFGKNCFMNSIVWMFNTRSSIKSSWKRSHHDILFYKKLQNPIFNWNHEMVIEELSEATIKKYRLEDENGKYRLNGRNIVDSPIKSAKDVDHEWEIKHPELVVRDYLRDGKVANDFFFINIENQASNIRTNYPTQKPEELLYKLLSASTKQNSIVLDCFMGSGTAQAVAMKLGRRFIGADINLGAIQTTTKRLNRIIAEKKREQPKLSGDDKLYLNFEVYNVNNYDVFRNPVQARDLLIQTLEIDPLESTDVFDGMKDGYKVKIMPVNRIASRADLNSIISGINYRELDKAIETAPGKPADKIKLVCMGHEPDLAAQLKMDIGAQYRLEVEVVDILRDRTDLIFKYDSEAKIVKKGTALVIKQFYPRNLLQKLSILDDNVNDWRELVETVAIDWNYNGEVLQPAVYDCPGKNELVKGQYPIPADHGLIRVKITDLLSESLEQTVEFE